MYVSMNIYTGLLTNFFSFTSYTYKIGLVYCLIDRAYKINNTIFGFNQDMSKVKEVLNRNMFPSHLVETITGKYLEQVDGKNNTSSEELSLHYFKLPYIGKHSDIFKK